LRLACWTNWFWWKKVVGGKTGILATIISRMLKKSASAKKVEVQAKVEIRRVRSSLNLDLDLSLPQKLWPF
jgi:hypothetical protein